MKGHPCNARHKKLRRVPTPKTKTISRYGENSPSQLRLSVVSNFSLKASTCFCSCWTAGGRGRSAFSCLSISEMRVSSDLICSSVDLTRKLLFSDFRREKGGWVTCGAWRSRWQRRPGANISSPGRSEADPRWCSATDRRSYRASGCHGGQPRPLTWTNLRKSEIHSWLFAPLH